MASTLGRNETSNNFPIDSTLQIDVDAPWWTQHRRRRARSPLYSEHSDAEELPELLVERQRPRRQSSPHEDTRRQLRGDVPSSSPRRGMNHGESHPDESGELPALPPDANVTIRRPTRAPSRDQNTRERECRRKDRPFKIYQLCNCTDHVCPNPYHGI